MRPYAWALALVGCAAAPPAEPRHADEASLRSAHEDRLLDEDLEPGEATEVLLARGQAERQMGRPAAALATWRGAVCDEGETSYARCSRGGPPDAVAEVFFWLGELHFDDSALDLAIGAYERAVTIPHGRVHGRSLYKLAWALYLADRYEEALRRFVEVLDLGRPSGLGSLREEALAYAAILIASDEWGPGGTAAVLARLGALAGRADGFEVASRTGRVLLDEARHAEAIAVWEYASTTWPQQAAEVGLDRDLEKARRTMRTRP